MPSIYVNVPKLPQDKKDALVKGIFDAAQPVLKAPHIYTFVNEYETRYENGLPAPEMKMIVANIEAGPTKEAKVDALGQGMMAAVKAVLGEDMQFTLVFHSNPLENIWINGKTIAASIRKD